MNIINVLIIWNQVSGKEWVEKAQGPWRWKTEEKSNLCTVEASRAITAEPHKHGSQKPVLLAEWVQDLLSSESWGHKTQDLTLVNRAYIYRAQGSKCGIQQ